MHHNSPYQLPKAIERLSRILRCLPGIGARAAQRCAFEMTGWDAAKKAELTKALESTFSSIKACSLCGSWLEELPCYNCGSSDTAAPSECKRTLCLVAHPRQVYNMESILSSAGVTERTYQVLGGLIDPLRGIEVENLRIRELLQRLQRESFEEIIFALDTTIEGDATSNILIEMLEERFPGISSIIRKPAFGIPINSSIEFVDAQTLAQAFSKRADSL